MAGMSPVLPVTERKPQADVIAGNCKRGKGLLQQEFTGTGPTARPKACKGSPGGNLLAESRDGRRAGVSQEFLTADSLVLLADRGCGHAEGMQRPKEPLVGLMLPGNRPVSVPARAAQLVEAAVIAGPGERVGGDRITGRHRPLREGRPGGTVGRESRRDVRGVAGCEGVASLRVGRKERLWRSAQQILVRHALILPPARRELSAGHLIPDSLSQYACPLTSDRRRHAQLWRTCLTRRPCPSSAGRSPFSCRRRRRP